MPAKISLSSTQQRRGHFQPSSVRRRSNYYIDTLIRQVAGSPTEKQQYSRYGDRHEISYSLMALVVKLGLISLSAVSLIKVFVVYQERLKQHSEVASVLNLEYAKLYSIQHRFDSLFTIGGNLRFLDEQDHLIAPNRLRVIWR